MDFSSRRGVRVIARLLPGQRLLVTFLVLLLPLMFAGRAYITAVPRSQIQFSEQERIGVQYLRPVTALLLQITKAQQSSGRGIDGREVDAAVTAVDAADKQYGQALKTSRLWVRWEDLLSTVRSGGTPTLDQYNQLTKGLADLMAYVAETSNLILDPGLDSYHLMNLVVFQVPILLDQVGQAVQLAPNGNLQVDNRTLLVVVHSNIEHTANAIASDLTTSLVNTSDPRARAAAAQLGAAIDSQVARTLRMLNRGPVAGSAAIDISGLLASVSKLSAASTQRLDDLLAGRIATLQDSVRRTTEILAGMSVLVMVLAIGRNRAVRMIRRQTDALRQQAFLDAQTGLANRAAFDATLPRMLRRRGQGEHGPALFILDIDQFKTVNDRYGHHIGDQLLDLTARRLTALVGGGGLVFRLGGDEFAVILDEGNVNAALVMAQRMSTALSEPADLDGIHLARAISVGLYVPDEMTDAEQSLIRADEAMFFAKSTGRRYQLFDPEKHRGFIERYKLEVELRAATRLGQIELYYQPIADLASRRIVAAEALIRWNHPTRGFLEPDAFIEVAEESGAIVDLGRWVLNQACADGQHVVEGMPADQQFKIAVNLSRRQLGSQALGRDVSDALQTHNLSPQRLTLEVTETALTRDEDVMVGLLHRLKVLGVELAMDDFGTGYSSMAQLRTMPVDLLKIDKVFIGGSTRGDDEWAFTAAIISLAHSVGKRTLAEGIEHPSQIAHLRSLGCDLGQGYLLGRPMPLLEFIRLLAATPGRTGQDR